MVVLLSVVGIEALIPWKIVGLLLFNSEVGGCFFITNPTPVRSSCGRNALLGQHTMTEKDLYAMFMTIGPIESCRVMKDFKTGYSYGFGFVNFTREEDAQRAIETFNGYQLRNKRLKVSYARPSGEDIKDTNLYVTNLPRAITEDQLETIFGKYGRIVQKHILRDKSNGTPRGVAFVRDKSNGTPRGVAFVRFDKREEAQEAIAALNNVIPEGGTEPLSVKVAEEHGKQKAAYYAGWAAGFHHNRGDFAWPCGNCMMDPWEKLSMGGSYPTTPRNGGCRPGACANTRMYPNYIPGKGAPRGRGRNLPWAPGFGAEERFKGQRCRTGPTPYW
ncbi:RNA recognition motif domain-containing protein [Phthorimaea operculella]|nr:RNA recognition motif domain-containing protein [Phthorimaea operculella]